MSLLFYSKNGRKTKRLSFSLKNWVDERLVWNPDEYDDIQFLTANAKSIWTPMLILENT